MRKYFAKRIGWHWEVWFRRADCSVDPANGAYEWSALWAVRFWRQRTALWIAQEMQVTFRDGMFVQRCLDDEKYEDNTNQKNEKLVVTEAMRK